MIHYTLVRCNGMHDADGLIYALDICLDAFDDVTQYKTQVQSVYRLPAPVAEDAITGTQRDLYVKDAIAQFKWDNLVAALAQSTTTQENTDLTTIP